MQNSEVGGRRKQFTKVVVNTLSPFSPHGTKQSNQPWVNSNYNGVGFESLDFWNFVCVLSLLF